MTISDSIMTTIIGMLVVFLALIVLAFFIRILSAVILSTKSKNVNNASAPDTEIKAQVSPKSEHSGLELIDTTEPNAAVIMAIVSDKTGIPLNMLRFKSIKAIK
ncbi:MAG: OadG family protein [Bacillota bacterium]|nr:OadG family protein [Bacillota bacterium]